VRPVASPALPVKDAFVLHRRSMRNWRPHLTSAFAFIAAFGLFQLASLRPQQHVSADSAGSLQTALLRASTPDALRAGSVQISATRPLATPSEPIKQTAISIPAPVTLPKKTQKAMPVAKPMLAKRTREKTAPLQIALAEEQPLALASPMRTASAQCADTLLRQSLSSGNVPNANLMKHCQ
jgi:hypothetical protein